MAAAWYYALNGEQKGPVTTEELKTLVASRQLSFNDLIWKKGLAEWVTVDRVRELVVLMQASAVQTAETQPETTVQTQAKNVAQPQTPKESPPSEELRLVPEFDDPKEPQKQQVPQKTGQSAQEATPQSKSAQNPKQQPAPKPQSATNPQPARWYYTQNGQQQGPVTAQFLKEKALSGELLPTDHLWKEGLKDWVAASALPGLKFPAQTVQTSQPATQPAAATPIVATPIETDEPFGAPDANSIFDIMNDPSFAAAPAATAEKPNAGLATMPSEKKKKKKSSDDSITEEEIFTPENMVSAEGFGAILFLIVAGVFVWLSIWHHSYITRLNVEGITTEGTVTDVYKSYGSTRVGRARVGGSNSYQPTISFATEDGQHFSFKAAYSSREYVVGEKVEIIYLSSDPNRVEINGSSTFDFINGWTIAVGVCLFFAAASAYKWLTGRQKLAAASWG